jgi:uncharacterized iron-regulated membrane protein
MAGNTQMNENERGIMTLHGLVGGIIATVLLLSILAGLTYFGINAQANNATKYYQINQDIHAIKSGSTFSEPDQQDGSKNYTYRTMVK